MKRMFKMIIGSALLMMFVLDGCSTGRVFTTTQSSTTGFSYSLPETVVKIDLPVKFWVKGTKDATGKFTATDNKGFLEIDSDATNASTPIALEMEAYPAEFSFIVLDQGNNVTSLEKFEINYYTTGPEQALQSTGILKTINSEMTDKTADIIKNYTDTAIQLGKLALGVQGFLQAADQGAAVVLLKDRITVSVPLHKGYQAMNDQLARELKRVVTNIESLEDGRVIVNASRLFGIGSLSIDGSVNGWPARGGADFLTKKLVADGNTTFDNILVERNHVTLINGIVYPDARTADFTLTIGIRVPDKDPFNKVIRFSGQVPEAGRLKMISINPKIFGKRSITAEFARNGRLIKWGYTSPSRAEKLSTFMKEQATALNTGGTELLTKARQNQVDAATRRANSDKLRTQIVTKEGELELAKATVINSKQAYDVAAEAYEKGKDTSNAASLLLVKNTAEQAYLTAQNKVKTAESELEALKNKKGDVESGLVTP
jgi:hypothetical protein